MTFVIIFAISYIRNHMDATLVVIYVPPFNIIMIRVVVTVITSTIIDAVIIMT